MQAKHTRVRIYSDFGHMRKALSCIYSYTIYAAAARLGPKMINYKLHCRSDNIVCAAQCK